MSGRISHYPRRHGDRVSIRFDRDPGQAGKAAGRDIWCAPSKPSSCGPKKGRPMAHDRRRPNRSPSRPEPEVRIHLSPAGSPLRTWRRRHGLREQRPQGTCSSSVSAVRWQFGRKGESSLALARVSIHLCPSFASEPAWKFGRQRTHIDRQP
jgi:hypothetical protein